MAEAFLATTTNGGESPFVLKRIRPDRADSREYQKRFLLEAQVVSRVVDDNLVRFREFGRVGDCYYLTMNQVRGFSLHRLFEPIFRRGAHPPLAVAAHLGRGVLHGLAALHGVTDEEGRPRPMVHRDVTPKNVIVSVDGEAVLIDFGITKDMYGPSITLPGQLIGTARYMAPEHRRAEFIDTRADVFSASVILYELFAGDHPWPPDSNVRELLKEYFEPPEIPADVRERVPDDVLAVIVKGLACEPDERWDDATQMARALERSSAYEVDSGPEAVVRWLEASELQLDEELSRPVIDVAKPVEEEAEVFWTNVGTLSSKRSSGPAPAHSEASEVLAIPPLPPRRDAVLTGSTADLTKIIADARRRQGWMAVVVLVVAVALVAGLVALGAR